MRITSKVVGLGIAVVASLALAGCVQSPPAVIPTSEPSVTPVFKTDAAALAAAKKAYLGYSATSDSIGAAGGVDPQRIAKWVTPSDLSTEVKVFNDFSKTGDRLVGNSVISRFTLEQFDQNAAGRVSLTAYACDDVSGSRLMDAAGKDVTPSTRASVVPLEVRFKNSRSNSNVLLIDGSVPWSGEDFCS